MERAYFVAAGAAALMCLAAVPVSAQEMSTGAREWRPASAVSATGMRNDVPRACDPPGCLEAAPRPMFLRVTAMARCPEVARLRVKVEGNVATVQVQVTQGTCTGWGLIRAGRVVPGNVDQVVDALDGSEVKLTVLSAR